MARILVADDNSNIQKMVALALQEQGVEVIGVGNGEAAVRKVPELRPDVILADVFMPVRSGYEVCEFVKNDSRFSHIPVVLLVGAFDPLDENEAQRVRADGVLKEPFVPPDPLVNLVKALLVKSAGEKLVAVAAPVAVATTTASVGSKVARQTLHPEFDEEPPEELAIPRPSLKVNEHDKPVAFGALLEAPTEEPPALDPNDPVLTSLRDPNLGEPAFWTRPPQTEEEVEAPADESDPTEHSWGHSKPLPEAADVAAVEPEEPIELDRDPARVRALEIPSEEEPALADSHELPVPGPPQDVDRDLFLTPEIAEQAPVIEEPEATSAATLIEWPRAEESLPLSVLAIPQVPPVSVQAPANIGLAEADIELEAPIGSEPPAVWTSADPSLESTATQAAERQAVWHAAPERSEEAALQAEDEIPLVAAEPEPSHEDGKPEAEPEKDSTTSWPPALVPATIPAEPARATVPTVRSAKWASLDEPMPLTEFPKAPAVPAPAIVSVPRSTEVSVAKPVETASAVIVPDAPKANVRDNDAAAITPEMIDTVVNRIVDRMQPQVLELITREILRPVVEALVRREIEKK